MQHSTPRIRSLRSWPGLRVWPKMHDQKMVGQQPGATAEALRHTTRTKGFNREGVAGYRFAKKGALPRADQASVCVRARARVCVVCVTVLFAIILHSFAPLTAHATVPQPAASSRQPAVDYMHHVSSQQSLGQSKCIHRTLPIGQCLLPALIHCVHYYIRKCICCAKGL